SKGSKGSMGVWEVWGVAGKFGRKCGRACADGLPGQSETFRKPGETPDDPGRLTGVTIRIVRRRSDASGGGPGAGADRDPALRAGPSPGDGAAGGGAPGAHEGPYPHDG